MPNLNPEWIVAGCAVITLCIMWTSTVIGGMIWLARRFDSLKSEILAEFQTKHEENSQTVKALEALVMRHDIILDPEFNGSGKTRARQ